jgi:hypothetical protein
MSLNPSPPAYFGWIIICHDTQLVLLLPSLQPHQNLRIKELICSHKPRGSLKHDIENVGIACATDLISTRRIGRLRLARLPAVLKRTLIYFILANIKYVVKYFLCHLRYPNQYKIMNHSKEYSTFYWTINWTIWLHGYCTTNTENKYDLYSH